MIRSSSRSVRILVADDDTDVLTALRVLLRAESWEVETATSPSLVLAALSAYETRWRARLGPDIRAGLAFRAVAARLDDRAVNAMVRLARLNGIVPLVKQHADFNWHRGAALALLRNPSFRRIIKRF